jgi:large subunit ribosomal protein L28
LAESRPDADRNSGIVADLEGLRKGPMARKDEITGKGPVSGNHVSHAHNKAKRRFEVNLQKKRFYVPEEDRWVTLRVSTQTIKTINKKGIKAVLDDAKARGIKL